MCMDMASRRACSYLAVSKHQSGFVLAIAGLAVGQEGGLFYEIPSHPEILRSNINASFITYEVLSV